MDYVLYISLDRTGHAYALSLCYANSVVLITEIEIIYTYYKFTHYHYIKTLGGSPTEKSGGVLKSLPPTPEVMITTTLSRVIPTSK